MNPPLVPTPTEADDATDAAERRQGGMVEWLVRQIRQDIGEGRWSAGQRLPEPALQQAYAVSRGTVREALRLLTMEGVLEALPNSGSRVRALGRDDFLELIEIREALERLAVRRVAAQSLSDEVVRELEQLHQGMGEAMKQGLVDTYNDLYTRFHSLLVRLSGSQALKDLYSRFDLLVFRQQLRPLIHPKLVSDSHQKHERLLKALLSGDASAAEKAISQHLMVFMDALRRLPASAFRNPSG